ncbi:MAG: hypothetical protein ACXAAO_12760 [Candidatus Thorarchaeota archaeon]
MSEIPMPASDPYEPAKPASSGAGSCVKIVVIICVLLIIGMIVIAMIFWGGIASIFGGIIGGGSTYDTRSIASYSNSDVDLSPIYYYAEFDVSSSDTQTSTSPDLFFDISIGSTGTDSVTVTIHYAVYETDGATVYNAATWSELNIYLLDDGDTTSSVNSYINLNNYADTYTWVLWFEASSKLDTWSVDIDLTLRYNWNL